MNPETNTPPSPENSTYVIPRVRTDALDAAMADKAAFAVEVEASAGHNIEVTGDSGTPEQIDVHATPEALRTKLGETAVTPPTSR